MKKGEETRQRILDKGFEMASRLGLECLSIGALAYDLVSGLEKISTQQKNWLNVP